MGEATIIFTAIAGVVVLLRMTGRKDEKKGMSEIVQGIARMVFPFIVLYGISLVLYGHITPGGGFAGGVILTGGLVLLILAFGHNYALRFCL